MSNFKSISINPDIQEGAPVFAGTRVQVEMLYDYARIGLPLRVFLDEFPSVGIDQAREVLDLIQRKVTIEQLKQMASNNNVGAQAGNWNYLGKMAGGR